MRICVLLICLLEIVMCDDRVVTTLKYSKYKTFPTIVNGKPIDETQVPYLVSLKEPSQKLEPDKVVWKNICGGTILDSVRVLTAAHCFEGNNFFYAKRPGILRAVAGSRSTELVHTGDTETTTVNQWRKPKKVILHKHFNFPYYDIALLFVDVPWKFNDKVRSIPLSTKHFDYAKVCNSSGFGRVSYDSNNYSSPILLSAPITIMPNGKCSFIWEMNMAPFICTESVVTDVARGDSGGPLTCTGTGEPSVRSEDEILVGVVSAKNFDKTTLFTRISAYKDWIRRGKGFELRPNISLVIILLVLIYLLFYCPRSNVHCFRV